jgi:hypothetical protein
MTYQAADNWNPHAETIAMTEDGKPIGVHNVRLVDLISQDEEFIRLYKMVCGVTRMSPDKVWVIYQLTKHLVPGAVVEVGVYRGGFLRWLIERLPGRFIDGYDTFAGIPDSVRSEKDSDFPTNWFADSNMFDVWEFIEGEFRCPYVNLTESLFPNGYTVPREQLALVHIDVDNYATVLAALDRLYSLVVPNGVIVVDDYGASYAAGVKTAADEYMANKPEPIMQFVQHQAIIIKR